MNTRAGKANLILAMLLTGASSSAQVAGFGVASSGYKVPASAITAAPGQVLVISVYGVAESIPQPLHGVVRLTGFTNTPTLSTQLGGLALIFNQGTTRVPVPLYLVSQSSCPTTQANCAITNITLQVPYEMKVAQFGSVPAPASITVQENGASLGAISLRPVADNVHVLSSCDETAVGTGLLGSASDLPCIAAVTHGSGQLVKSSSPAKPGEQLAMFVYGLGATNPAAPTGVLYLGPSQQLTTQTFTMSFDFRANAPGNRPLPAASVLATPVFAGLPQSVVGIYQVNFVVPAIPAGSNLPACDGTFITSNMTVTLLGPTSLDGAPICVSR